MLAGREYEGHGRVSSNYGGYKTQSELMVLTARRGGPVDTEEKDYPGAKSLIKWRGGGGQSTEDRAGFERSADRQ